MKKQMISAVRYALAAVLMSGVTMVVPLVDMDAVHDVDDRLNERQQRPDGKVPIPDMRVQPAMKRTDASGVRILPDQTYSAKPTDSDQFIAVDRTQAAGDARATSARDAAARTVDAALADQQHVQASSEQIADGATIDPAVSRQIQDSASSYDTPAAAPVFEGMIPIEKAGFFARIASFFRDVVALGFQTLGVGAKTGKVTLGALRDLLGEHTTLRDAFKKGGFLGAHDLLVEHLCASGDKLAAWSATVDTLHAQLVGGVERLRTAAERGVVGAQSVLKEWENLEALVGTYADLAHTASDIQQLIERVPAIHAFLEQGGSSILKLVVNFDEGMKGDQAKGIVDSLFGALTQSDSVEELANRRVLVDHNRAELDRLINGQEAWIESLQQEHPVQVQKVEQAERLLGNLKRGRALLKTYADMTSAMSATKQVVDVAQTVKEQVDKARDIAEGVKENALWLLEQVQRVPDQIASLWRDTDGASDEDTLTQQDEQATDLQSTAEELMNAVGQMISGVFGSDDQEQPEVEMLPEDPEHASQVPQPSALTAAAGVRRAEILGHYDSDFLKTLATNQEQAEAELKLRYQNSADQLKGLSWKVDSDLAQVESIVDQLGKDDKDAAELQSWESLEVLLIEYQFMVRDVRGKAGLTDKIAHIVDTTPTVQHLQKATAALPSASALLQTLE